MVYVGLMNIIILGGIIGLQYFQYLKNNQSIGWYNFLHFFDIFRPGWTKSKSVLIIT